MSLSETINGKCWALVDAVHLGNLFDRYNLPPILLPLIIVLAALAVFWLLTAPAAAPPCGDGICAAQKGESIDTCPMDCNMTVKGAGITVTVEIADSVDGSLTVMLFDKDERQVGTTETKMASVFEFAGVQPDQKLSARVICPNGAQQDSRPKTVTSGSSKITITLPDGCFEYIIDGTGDPVQTVGSVFVTVTDAETGEPIDDAAVTAVRDSDGITQDTQYTTGGMCTLNLPSDVRYYITASASSYEAYTSYQRFFMLAGESREESVSLQPLFSSAAYGSLTVCARSGSRPLSGGTVSVSEIGGGELPSQAIGSSGCATFSGIESGKLVRAVLTNPPSGCIAPSPSEAIMVDPTMQNTVNFEVSCGQQEAYVKVIVHDQEGNVLTNSTTVTLWNAVTHKQIPGSAADSSLEMSSGGYTEEVTVPADTLIQAKAVSPPVAFVDTPSGPTSFQPGEHGSIDVILGERDRGGFTFLGASIIYTPATPGSPVKVFVQQITYNGTVLTPQNSEVVVLIDGKEYGVSYS